MTSEPTTASRLLRIREIADAFGIKHPSLAISSPPTPHGPEWIVTWAHREHVAFLPNVTVPLGDLGLTLDEALDSFIEKLEDVLAAHLDTASRWGVTCQGVGKKFWSSDASEKSYTTKEAAEAEAERLRVQKGHASELVYGVALRLDH